MFICIVLVSTERCSAESSFASPWDKKLQGVIVTALSYYMQMWTIAKRGPVFLAMSMPLTLIFTIIISSFVLGEAVSLGRFVRPESLMKLRKSAIKLYSTSIYIS